jgi:hypothetical protein
MMGLEGSDSRNRATESVKERRRSVRASLLPAREDEDILAGDERLLGNELAFGGRDKTIIGHG